MFRIENNVPEVYVQQSRDFQLLCRLADLVVQSSRYSINSMSDVSATQYCNDNILDLLKTKVGFFSSHTIDTDALRSILISYPHIIRHKGSLKSLRLIQSLFNRISISCIYSLDVDSETRTVEVILTKPIIYIDVLQDLLQSLLPTGYSLIFKVYIEQRLDDEYLETSDNLKITYPEKDNIKDYNVITDMRNTSRFGSILDSSQLITYEQYQKSENLNEETD